MKFDESVKDARLSRGLSIEQFSDLTMNTVGFLEKIESGEITSVTLDVMRIMAKAVGMTMSELLYNVE